MSRSSRHSKIETYASLLPVLGGVAYDLCDALLYGSSRGGAQRREHNQNGPEVDYDHDFKQKRTECRWTSRENRPTGGLKNKECERDGSQSRVSPQQLNTWRARAKSLVPRKRVR